MQTIKFKESGYLPGIILDKEAGKFQITGRACPEDPVEFYQPVFDWLSDYSENPLEQTVFEFKMTYYNTATSKILMMIMQKLEELAEKGNNVKVKWFYSEDDEDMYEAGEEYSEMVELEFELIPVED